VGKWRPMRERYPEVFRRHGLDVLGEEPDAVAGRIRASAVRADILAALDGWTVAELGRTRERRLLEVAWRADEANPWRRELLKPGLLRDPKRVKALVGQLREDRLAPASLLFLSRLLRED